MPFLDDMNGREKIATLSKSSCSSRTWSKYHLMTKAF